MSAKHDFKFKRGDRVILVDPSSGMRGVRGTVCGGALASSRGRQEFLVQWDMPQRTGHLTYLVRRARTSYYYDVDLQAVDVVSLLAELEPEIGA